MCAGPGAFGTWSAGPCAFCAMSNGCYRIDRVREGSHDNRHKKMSATQGRRGAANEDRVFAFHEGAAPRWPRTRVANETRARVASARCLLGEVFAR